jgi:hypothetical protein
MPKTFRPDFVVVEPVEGVLLEEGTWRYPPLDLRIPAPPDVVRPGTLAEAHNLALQALELGLASTKAVPKQGFLRRLQRLAQPGPLPPTVSAPVKSGRRRAALQALVMMLPTIGGPMLAAAAAWLVLGLVNEPVLALLASFAFLILISLPIHELGHICAFRTLHPEAPALFSVKTGRFRLMRGMMPPGQDVGVTLAGPVAPFIVPLLLLPASSWYPLQFWLSAVVAFSHLSLLARGDGDGAALRSALKHPQEAAK